MTDYHVWDCPCEACQAAREAWAALQPPLAESLPTTDGDDRPQ